MKSASSDRSRQKAVQPAMREICLSPYASVESKTLRKGPSIGMLLLWSLVHVLATSRRPVLGHLQPREEPLISCNDINCRTLFSIISSCLATIFACTWVSIHPNVPPPNQSQLALTWQRLCLMLVAVIAPELMVGFAARQFLDARWFSKEYSVSKAHGFFFAMGGFVSHSGRHPIVTRKQLRPEYLAAIQSISVEDIDDKSKGDGISKAVALLQGLWFTAQCLARVHQHLPLTELEVATLAFQFVNIFIWLLWWNKPLDVQRPILLCVGNDSLNASTTSNGATVTAAALVFSIFPTFDPESSTSVPSFWSTHGTDKRVTHLVSFTVQALVGTIFGAIHCAVWNANFPTTDEMWMCRCCSLVAVAIPFAVALTYIPTRVFDCPDNWNWKGCWKTLPLCTFYIAVPIYIVARLFLIVLPLTTLRGVPPGILVDVNWSMYIPSLCLSSGLLV
ncbi:hypothetical protein B0H19DRAFT_980099 [Mycena capillaripes]|nr:hypothetical protein B0H19DRAFT_980099 [Mycena capillaripes]